MIVSLSFYGMSTFEGPMMSIKTVNALSLHGLDDRACALRRTRLGGHGEYRLPARWTVKKLWRKSAKQALWVSFAV